MAAVTPDRPCPAGLASPVKPLLRFITCGSVDDGKSTLIGRLLYDGRLLTDDQIEELRRRSAAVGGSGELDLALLTDGLAAEREQGITIDVAYRFFETAHRRFIVADAPGHEQYLRNMVTGASTAELAVILVDAGRGVMRQTRRHAYLVDKLGVRQVILAVNKMDAVGYEQRRFDEIAAAFRGFAAALDLRAITAIPLSARSGDNVWRRSTVMGWYDGPTLIEQLEHAASDEAALQAQALRLPVQLVVRHGADFRGYAGTIAAGTMRPGDRVRVMPAGTPTTIARIVAPDGDDVGAVADEAVTVTLADKVDCGRGDVIAAADDPPAVADQFEAMLVWMAAEDLLPGRGYWLKIGTRTVTATVSTPKYVLNFDTLERLAAKTFATNMVGVATVTLDEPVCFAPYAQNRHLGGFILIDKASRATVAAGMLHFALRRSHTVRPQAIDVGRDDRAALKRQRPAVIWLTGLSGAGKSTIANLLDAQLAERGFHTALLDGDNLRHGLNRDLGFTEADRVENIRRAGEVARLMSDAGLIVIAAFIAPFAAERAMVRAMIAADEFIEVHVDTPLAVAEARDVKGLYARARSGALANFTGIDSPYETPVAPEIRIDTVTESAEVAAGRILSVLLARQPG